MAPGPSRGTRSGFIMMFTLVAVALAGLVMVETAPDFSNYAVLTKGDEFARNLSLLRQVTAAHPFCLTTSDTIDPVNPTTGVLTSDDIYKCLQGFVVSPGSTVSSSRVFISTVPRDPYVPPNNWLSNTKQSKFWAASYNLVRNPSFYAGSREEAYLDSAFKIYFNRDTSPAMERRIFRCDRFGLRTEQICYLGPNTEMGDCSMSPDGSTIAFSSPVYDPGPPAHYNIFIVGTNTFLPKALTDHRRLTGTPCSFRHPAWSAGGGRLAFVQTEDGSGRKDLILSSCVRDDPGMPYAEGAHPITTGASAPVLTNIGGIAFAPFSEDEAFNGRSRYLVFTFHDGSGWYLSLYDLKTRTFIFDRSTGAASPEFEGSRAFPCDGTITPVWISENALLYGQSGGGGAIRLLREPGRYPAAMTVSEVTGITDVDQMKMVPGASSLNGSPNWLVYVSRSNHYLYRVPIFPLQPGGKTPFLIADDMNFDNNFDVSPRGSLVTYPDRTRQKLMLVGVDGTHRTVVSESPAPPTSIWDVFFGQIEQSWVGPAPFGSSVSHPNIKIVSPAIRDTKQYLDGNAWRSFLNENLDYPGDFKFANSWLRLHPPENQDQLLFDDGEIIWRVSTEHPSVKPPTGTVFFLGKIDPTWSWQGTTYISKEALDPTGGEPADLFKQAFHAATTLIAGRGYTPDMAPNDREFCYSKAQSTLSTFPGDSTTYPIDDVNLWVSNTSGAAEPAPRCITPDTPESFESEPSYSPDGRYIYYTRERQHYSTFLASHEASICRVTPYGGTNIIIQESGSITPEWSDGKWTSQMEFYHPSVSPDGTRVAFVGKERLTGTGALAYNAATDEYEPGDIITECLYVKDVLFNSEPALLLRCVNSFADFPAASTKYLPADATVLTSCSITALTWTPDGEEILATISRPMNYKFPKCINERPSTDPNHYSRNFDKRYYDLATEQIVLAVPVSISHFQDGTIGHLSGPVNSREFPSGTMDPPGYTHGDGDYRLVLQSAVGTAPGQFLSDRAEDADKVPDWSLSSKAHKKIFNTVHSKGAYCYQRIVTDSPFFSSDGFSLGIWYILSGYVRTSLDAEALHSAQMMVQLFNNRGTLVALAPPDQGKVFQVGYPDIGGTEWTRFSAAIKFDIVGFLHPKDMPPYYVNLMLYFTGKAGTWAEFTGLKLEKAFDTNTLRPTRFSPGWILFSPSILPDPQYPGSFLFER